jgi:photosystem II stability/assembly factor-like uncharacterized protein
LKAFYQIFHIRFLFIVAIALLAALSQVKSQWEDVTNRIPRAFQGNYWLDVFFLPSNPQYGWICGFNGMILRTTDGGKTWQGNTISDANQLESIHFADSLTGYTSGTYRYNPYLFHMGVIYKTTDGGATWSDVSDKLTEDLWGCYFLTPDIGMVVGGGCGTEHQYFFRTQDGGETWNLFEDSVPNTGLSDVIIFEKNGLGFASSSGKIWRTLDGGFNWEIFSQSGDNDWQEEITYYDRSFLVPYSDSCEGSFEKGGMRFSIDYGKTWRDYRTNYPMFGTFLLNKYEGWACGQRGALYYTPNGGIDWVMRKCGIEDTISLDDIWFINDSTGWIVGTRILKYKKINYHNPVIKSSQPMPVCFGDSVTLSVDGNFNYYLWSNGAATPEITVNRAGIYWVKVANDECDSSFSQLFEVEYLKELIPEIIAEPAPNLCEGDSLVLKTIGKYVAYIWSTGDTTEQTTVYKDGEYSITVFDEYGCSGSSSIVINLLPKPELHISANGTTNICVGYNVLLSAEPDNPKITWYKEDAPQDAIGSGKYYSATEAGDYYAIAENEYGCANKSNDITVTTRVDSNRIVIQTVPPDKLMFDSTFFLEKKLLPLILMNIGGEPFVFDDVFVVYNIEFSIPQSQFPFVLEPGETKSLMVACSPVALGYRVDTLILPDNCAPHLIEASATGASNKYTASSGCDVEYLMKTARVTGKQYYIIRKPFPNPAANVLKAGFTAILPTDNNSIASAYLSNILGEKVKTATVEVQAASVIDGVNYIDGEYLFDLSGAASGYYLLQINTGYDCYSFPVIIE